MEHLVRERAATLLDPPSPHDDRPRPRYGAALVGVVNCVIDKVHHHLPHLAFIELYVGTPQIRRHYERVAQAAQGWDGRDPVREYARLIEV